MTEIVIAITVLVVFFCIYSIFPSFFLRFRQSIQRRKKSREDTKILYLTFDDGPDIHYTGTLLALLKKYGIKASFFVVSEFAEAHPELISQMKEEGHLIGIHSEHHNNALFRGNRFACQDMAGAVYTMKQLGCEAVYYRPPWGHLNLCTLHWLKKLNLQLVFWDVMAQDWSKKETSKTIEKKILSRTYPGAVICLHDGRGAKGAPGRTIGALKDVLPVLLAQGYQFERLDGYE